MGWQAKKLLGPLREHLSFIAPEWAGTTTTHKNMHWYLLVRKILSYSKFHSLTIISSACLTSTLNPVWPNFWSLNSHMGWEEVLKHPTFLLIFLSYLLSVSVFYMKTMAQSLTQMWSLMKKTENNMFFPLHRLFLLHIMNCAVSLPLSSYRDTLLFESMINSRSQGALQCRHCILYENVGRSPLVSNVVCIGFFFLDAHICILLQLPWGCSQHFHSPAQITIKMNLL